MSDTNPLPAATLRSAEDARYKRLQVALCAHRHKAFITCPESCWCWEVDAVLTEHEAARLASPVTLEEALMARRYITDAEYSIGHGDEAKRFKAWMDAEREHEDHARTLAEAAPVKDSLTTDPAPPDTQRGEAPTTCRWWRDEYGNWCCACSNTMPDFTPWPSADPNGAHCPKCGKAIATKVHDKP